MSRATLKLEAIGDDQVAAYYNFKWVDDLYAEHCRARGQSVAPSGHGVRRPWVSELIRWRGGKWYDREFLDGQKDYSEANSAGSRGVYLYFHLAEGPIYEVRELLTWTRDRRYFCAVVDGEIVELSADEVQTALNDRAEREARLV